MTRFDQLKREALGSALSAYAQKAPLASEESLKLEKQFLEYFEQNIISQETTAEFFSQHAIPEVVLGEYQNNLKELVHPVLQNFSQWLPAEERSTVIAAFQEAADVELFLEQYPDVLAYLNVEIAEGRNIK